MSRLLVRVGGVGLLFLFLTAAPRAQAVCAALNCPGAAGCDQQFGPAAQNGEDAALGYDVNAGTGNLYLSFTDIEVYPALGPVLTFHRSYNGQAFGTNVGLGNGWTHSYSWAISLPGNTARILSDTGRAIYFTKNGAAWTAQAGEFGSLTGSGVAGFTYTDKYGTAYAFDTAANSGRLLTITPADNTAITVNYSAGVKIATVTSGDLALTFTYTGNNLTSIKDPANSTWSYGYTGTNLTSVTFPNTDSGGHHGQQSLVYGNVTVNGTLFSANANAGELTQIQELQTNGNSVTTGLFSYGGGAGVSQLVHAASGVIGGAFTRDLAVTYALCTNQNSTTSATLNGGGKTITSAQTSGFQRLTGLTASAGSGSSSEWGSASYTWNVNLTLASVVDGNGHTTAFQNYDALGNPGTIIEAQGTALARSTTLTYHSILSRPLTVTRASVDGVAGHNHVSTFDYDADYNANYNQNPTKYLHQMIESGYTDTALGGTLANQVAYISQIQYDAQNRVTQVGGPLANAQTTYTYWAPGAANHAGNRLNTSVVKTSATTTLTTSYTGYDADGRLLVSSDPSLVSTTLSFDALGYLTQKVVTQNLVSLTDSYAYDLAEELLAHTTPEGTTIKQEYDAARRMWRQHAETAGGAPTTPWSLVYDFNSWNRVVTLRRFSGLGIDELTGCTNAGTEQYCQERTWDAFGRLATNRLLDSANNSCAGNNCKIAYSFDANGNLQSTTEVGVNTTTYGRDALDRINQITLPTGKHSTISYDLNDQLLTRRDPKDSNNGGSGGNNRLTNYLSDDFRRLIKLISPDSGTWLHNYDAAGNEISSRDPAGTSLTYAFDLASRRTSLTSPNGNDSITFVYDEVGAIGGVNYTDTAGRLTSIKARDSFANRVFTHYAYDLVGRTIADVEERGPDLAPTTTSILYAWNSNGDLASLTYPDGLTATFKYPAANGFAPVPLPNELDAPYGGANTVLVKNVAYFADGVTSGLTYGSLSTRTLTRNLRGEWLHLVSGPAAGPFVDQTYGYDASGLGQLTAVHHFKTKVNAWDWTFGFDTLNRLTSYVTNVRPVSDNYAWAYDEVGNRTSQTYNTVNTPYAYDTNNNTSQLSAVNSSHWSWTYNANGAVATYNAANNNNYPYQTYAYNTRHQQTNINQQMSATVSNAVEVYVSDGLERRWQKTNAPTSSWTQFYYDLSGRILQEYSFNNTQVNGCNAYLVTDHFYLGSGANEVGRILRSFQSSGGCTAGSYSFVDTDEQFVHEDNRGPFGIESAATGLAWEVESDPFGNVVHQGLPGPDGKIGTNDDLAATATNLFGIFDSYEDPEDEFLALSLGVGRTRPLVASLGAASRYAPFDPAGGSAFARNGGPDSLAGLGGPDPAPTWISELASGAGALPYWLRQSHPPPSAFADRSSGGSGGGPGGKVDGLSGPVPGPVQGPQWPPILPPKFFCRTYLCYTCTPFLSAGGLVNGGAWPQEPTTPSTPENAVLRAHTPAVPTAGLLCTSHTVTCEYPDVGTDCPVCKCADLVGCHVQTSADDLVQNSPISNPAVLYGGGIPGVNCSDTK